MNVPMTILGLLCLAPLHGYDVKQLYDRILSPARPIKPGQVYSTLERLERDGSIEVVAREQEHGPERRRFAPTSLGRREVEEWLSNPEPPAPYLQSGLFAKLMVALLAGMAVEPLLDAQRAAHRERMREITRQRREGDLSHLLLSDYALFHLEADLRWMDLTAARLEQLKAEVQAEAAQVAEPSTSTHPGRRRD